MHLLKHYFLIAFTAVSNRPGLHGLASATSDITFCDLVPGTVKSSQPVAGDAFIGSPVFANPLLPKIGIEPASAELHADNGNTNCVNYPGPLGHNLNTTSLDWQYGQFFWDAHGTMFAVYGGPCNGSDTNFVSALAVINPTTLEFEGVWQPPSKYASTQLNFAYLQLLSETDRIVLSALQGQIYILQKSQAASEAPSIETSRLIDLADSDVLKGNTLLNVAMDAEGNVWFTSGALDGVDGADPTNTTIIGYVEHNGSIHSVEISNQSVGQGISVSNTTIFVNTEPSDSGYDKNAEGFITALRPGPGQSVHVSWNATYDAGSRQRPGAFARGSGTTPTLLGNDFVAVTDNADTQMNLLIYPQDATSQNQKAICKLPLFEPHASWTDNNALAHFDGENYGVVIQNMWNEDKFDPTHKNINGAYNNMTSMSPGISKIIVAGDGSGCYLEWTNPGRMNTVMVLSTATGLLYGYEQSKELADRGEYVWYVTAIDYESGKTVWKARTGAGGTFNNYYRTTFLSPEGTLYQRVQGGVVVVKDGT